MYLWFSSCRISLLPRKVETEGTEAMTEVPLGSLSLTWGTAWEVRKAWHLCSSVEIPASEVLDLDFFNQPAVLEFSNRVRQPVCRAFTCLILILDFGCRIEGVAQSLLECT